MTQKLGRYPLNNQTSIGLSRKRYNWRLLRILVVAILVSVIGLAGLVFGWFYWTFGLEAAMVSHFSGDIVLHVIWPMLAGH